MTLDLDSLAANPLFAHLDRTQLQQLLGALVARDVAAGTVLFEVGELPHSFVILTSGCVQLLEDGETRIRLDAPNPVGELAALAGWERDWTAVMETDGTVLESSVDRLREFLGANGALTVALHRGLLHMAVRKIARDKRRLGEMRDNIVTTQKAMKRMREALLEAEDTPLHAALHEELDTCIEANRRGHYLVEPSRLIRTQVRLDDGSVHAIAALSNEWLYIVNEGGSALEPGEDVGAVLIIDGDELPVRGNVDAVTDKEIVVFLDTVVETTDGGLEAHLARLHMLDTVL